MDSLVPLLLSALPFHGPWLLVAVIGLVLAFMNLNRHPTPAVLVLIASAVLLLGTCGYIFEDVYRWKYASETPEALAGVVSDLSIGSTVLRVLGVGLLLVAAFSGRSVAANTAD